MSTPVLASVPKKQFNHINQWDVVSLITEISNNANFNHFVDNDENEVGIDSFSSLSVGGS